MKNKWKKYGLWFFAFVVGLLAGFFHPETTQPMLSVLGIIAGLGFLFHSRSNADKKETASSVDWFVILQMLLYFIIGAALSMTLAFYLMMN